jgi:hypothetical protein
MYATCPPLAFILTLSLPGSEVELVGEADPVTRTGGQADAQPPLQTEELLLTCDSRVSDLAH